MGRGLGLCPINKHFGRFYWNINHLNILEGEGGHGYSTAWCIRFQTICRNPELLEVFLEVHLHLVYELLNTSASKKSNWKLKSSEMWKQFRIEMQMRLWGSGHLEKSCPVKPWWEAYNNIPAQMVGVHSFISMQRTSLCPLFWHQHINLSCRVK